MFSELDYIALLTTLKLATVTTVILLVFGTPLAWWLSRTQSRLKVFVEAFVALPLILPPTVLGFYLLLALGPKGPLKNIISPSLAFTFTGLVIGSLLYSLPFVVQPLQTAFCSIEDKYLRAASTLGASSINRFFSVVIPMSRTGFSTAAILGFAHTVGEFGVVLMIGGNIPGKTRVLSIAIYDHVEALEYGSAHLLSATLLLFSFLLLILIYLLNHNFKGIRS